MSIKRKKVLSLYVVGSGKFPTIYSPHNDSLYAFLRRGTEKFSTKKEFQNDFWFGQILRSELDRKLFSTSVIYVGNVKKSISKV